MRKLSLAFLISLMTVPAMADNWIKFKAQAVEDAINTLVAQENRVATKNEYEKQMDQTTGKISVMGIYKVCAAAGKDIRTNNGYSECRYFINYIAEKSNFGTKSATQANCANQFNGVWSLSADGKTYQCVGKDGYKLVYKKSCESEDANSKCIKDFAGLKTQGPIGREFIVEYGNKKNLKLTCYIGFETRRGLTSPLGQDYIRCSAGGKSYEFEFDSLNQDPGKTSVESENKAMCEFFGGKIVKHPDSSVEKFWQSCDISQDLCKGKLHSLALRIGHTTMYQGYCRFSREAKSTDYANLHTIKGVDSKIFYNSGAQMRSDMAKVQLEEYLRNTFPNESYIVCDPTAKKFNYGLGIDPDYVITCTVGSQQADFLFHDLTEGRKSRADTGMDAMQCIISGGTFKGESCRGPTKAECDNLDAALRARGSAEGAKWDDKVRACILGNAMKSYKEDVVTNYVVGAVVIVGGTLVVIGTGGVTAPVVVGGVEMLVGDLAINYAIDANHRRLSKQAANRFGSFIDEAEKCNSEQCALKILEKHYATLSGVWSDLNTDDQTIVNSTIDKLISLIKTEYVACGKNDKGQIVYATAAECAMKSSTLRAIDYIDKVSEPVLIIGSIVYNPGFVTTRFVRIKNISKVAKTMNVSYKETNQLVKAGKWADATVLDPTFDIKVTPLELGGKKYYLKSGNTKSLIQNEINRTKQAHELLKHNKIVTSVDVVEDDKTVLKAFMDAHPEITLPRTPDTQYFIMDATHANTVEELSDAEILGYLRNKPITIEEQNTILSEIQNMNNNGLIHNDIWHNFAIYRDSGGKLHMELMDFGDFTSAQKLERSNDDVLEIKKLFSRWSDRGLVEKK